MASEVCAATVDRKCNASSLSALNLKVNTEQGFFDYLVASPSCLFLGPQRNFAANRSNKVLVVAFSQISLVVIWCAMRQANLCSACAGTLLTGFPKQRIWHWKYWAIVASELTAFLDYPVCPKLVGLLGSLDISKSRLQVDIVFGNKGCFIWCINCHWY